MENEYEKSTYRGGKWKRADFFESDNDTRSEEVNTGKWFFFFVIRSVQGRNDVAIWEELVTIKK